MNHYIANRVLLGGLTAAVTTVVALLLIGRFGSLFADFYLPKTVIGVVAVCVLLVDRLYVYWCRPPQEGGANREA